MYIEEKLKLLVISDDKHSFNFCFLVRRTENIEEILNNENNKTKKIIFIFRVSFEQIP